MSIDFKPIGSVQITKGMHVRARWIKTDVVSLAGVQMKLNGNFIHVSGTVRHIRYDGVNADNAMLFIDLDETSKDACDLVDIGCSCGTGHVMVDPKHVWYLASAPEHVGNITEKIDAKSKCVT